MADVSPLRRRMIEDMTVRNLSPATQRSYVHAVTRFSRFFGRSPDRLDLEDVRWTGSFLVGADTGCFHRLAPSSRLAKPPARA